MKLESAAGLIVLFTAVWIICAYSYIYGIFLRYDSSLVGLISIDEAISSSAGKIATIVAIVMPINLATSHVLVRHFEKVGWFKDLNMVAYIAACVMCMVVIGLYLLDARGSVRYIFDFGWLFMAIVTAAPVTLGAVYDKSKNSFNGRLVSLFVTGLLASFALGAEPRFFPEAGIQKCVDIYSGEKIKASGKLLFATPSSVIIIEEAKSSLSYYKTDEIDRILSKECKLR